MTCAHVVHVALKKVDGVDAVEVSLNKGLATVKLKPGNTVSVPQLWELIHKNGYTPKATAVWVRGQVSKGTGGVALQVTGTKDTLALAPDPKNGGAYRDALGRIGRSVEIRGEMTPAKDLKTPVPLQVEQVQ